MQGRNARHRCRPADGQRYGVTTSGQIGTLDPKAGVFTKKADLSEKLKAGIVATVDSNPPPTAYALWAPTAPVFVNVDDGKVTVDGSHRRLFIFSHPV